jgi:hypothetical protein
MLCGAQYSARRALCHAPRAKAASAALKRGINSVQSPNFSGMKTRVSGYQG